MPSQVFVLVQICVEPDNGSFHAWCPGLKGLHVDGETGDQALANAKDAVVAYLESLVKHGEPIPVGITELPLGHSFSAWLSRMRNGWTALATHPHCQRHVERLAFDLHEVAEKHMESTEGHDVRGTSHRS